MTVAILSTSQQRRVLLFAVLLWWCRSNSVVILSHSNAFQQQPQHSLFRRPQYAVFRFHRQPHKYFSTANDQQQYSVRLSSDQLLSRPDAVHLLDTYILPTSEKGYRMNLNSNDMVIDSIDIDSSTYGEFSLTSLDIVLDRIEQEIVTANDAMDSCSAERRKQPLKIIDIGSGCGRLVLYMAIAQQQLQRYYDQIVVVGIEQSKALFDESIRATERLLIQCNNNNNNNGSDDSNTPMTTQAEEPDVRGAITEIRLYCGSARDFMNEIHTADIIICYSTAFASGNFSPSLSALLLSDEWNTIVTPPSPSSNRHPSVSSTATMTSAASYCVTMDKALDPSFGWAMIDRINVPNPEIGIDSVAFLQRIDR